MLLQGLPLGLSALNSGRLMLSRHLCLCFCSVGSLAMDPNSEDDDPQEVPAIEPTTPNESIVPSFGQSILDQPDQFQSTFIT